MSFFLVSIIALAIGLGAGLGPDDDSNDTGDGSGGDGTVGDGSTGGSSLAGYWLFKSDQSGGTTTATYDDSESAPTADRAFRLDVKQM